MIKNTERQIDPAFFGNYPELSEFDLIQRFVDDGRTAPRQTLPETGTGTSPKTGGVISLTVNPGDDILNDVSPPDPGKMPVKHGEIGYWSGEDGAANPFWAPPAAILPGGAGETPAHLPNGGPGGLSWEVWSDKDGVKSWEANQEKMKAQKEAFHKANTLQKWEDTHDESGSNNHKKAVDAAHKLDGQSEAGFIVDAILDWIGKHFLTDPEQGTGSVADPHAMIGALLGKGDTALPDNLGLDKNLIGRLLGEDAGSTSSGLGKLGTLLDRLDAFDFAVPGEAGALLQAFGLGDDGKLLREFLPHHDMEGFSLAAAAQHGPDYQEPVDYSYLLATWNNHNDYLTA